MGSAVPADSILHSLVFLHGGFCQLQAELKCFFHLTVSIINQLSNILLSERFCFYTVLREPGFHLHHAVRVLYTGDILHSFGEGGFGPFIKGDGVFHHIHIQGDTSVVDLLIEMIFIPDEVRDRVFRQALLYRHLDFHIALIVFLKEFPFLRIMLRKIPGATAVCLGWFTGSTEVADQIFALFQLLILKL